MNIAAGILISDNINCSGKKRDIVLGTYKLIFCYRGGYAIHGVDLCVCVLTAIQPVF